MKKSILLPSAILIGLATASSAQEVEADLGFSTLGPTLQGRYSFSDNLKLRGLIAGGIDAGSTQEIQGVNYNLDGSFRSFGLIADYHPLSNGFHLSAGLIAANLDINASARSDGASTVQVGNTTYRSAGDGLDLGIAFENSVAPYLGLGYNAALGSNWAVGAELGAMFTGGVDISGTAFGAVSQADLNTEIAEANGDLGSDADVYPFLSISVGFRF